MSDLVHMVILESGGAVVHRFYATGEDALEEAVNLAMEEMADGDEKHVRNQLKNTNNFCGLGWSVRVVYSLPVSRKTLNLESRPIKGKSMQKDLFNRAEDLFVFLNEEFHRKVAEVVEGDNYLLAEAITEGKTEEFFAPLKTLATLVLTSGQLMHQADVYRNSPPVI